MASDQGDAVAQTPGEDDPTAAAAAAAASIEAEIAQLKDQVLRAQAEADNVRRRAAREVENAHKFASADLIGALVPVLDNLERAVAAARAASQGATAGSEAGAIAEGIDLSVRLFADTLARFGVEALDPVDATKGIAILWIAYFHFFKAYANERYGAPYELGWLGRFVAQCTAENDAGSLACAAKGLFITFALLGFHAELAPRSARDQMGFEPLVRLGIRPFGDRRV